MRKPRNSLTLILPTNYFYNICTEKWNMRQQLKYLILQDSLCGNSHNVSAYFLYDPFIYELFLQ